jgi:hypothetical protein
VRAPKEKDVVRACKGLREVKGSEKWTVRTGEQRGRRGFGSEGEVENAGARHLTQGRKDAKCNTKGFRGCWRGCSGDGRSKNTQIYSDVLRCSQIYSDGRTVCYLFGLWGGSANPAGGGGERGRLGSGTNATNGSMAGLREA